LKNYFPVAITLVVIVQSPKIVATPLLFYTICPGDYPFGFMSGSVFDRRGFLIIAAIYSGSAVIKGVKKSFYQKK
jgi:hypothetical protein